MDDSLRLLIGALVMTIGYSPFFIGLAVLDLIGAVVLWTVVCPPAPASAATGGGMAA